MEKKKKNGAGAAFVLLVAAVKLIPKAVDSHISISVLYLLALAALLSGAYWVFTRLRSGSENRDLRPGGKRRLQGNPSAFPDSKKRSKARAESNQAAPGEDFLSSGKEQWRSLYEAGLIDREEYRERLNQTKMRG
ncbi:hypothetical protein EQM14_12785 [Caproiciproducens sp. NJN-50]|uniref:hypothetical protein n=1 Tax=Acutalibacteraceae TaxID=3082771 RepID=UPI000FFE312B|nr:MULTISPECIES: hypothetical protein [Acutalibacteraceae]QAT50566.1 hypothetical protein EQM14_12785 [Caproiciproducens sp. NJN-50]